MWGGVLGQLVGLAWDSFLADQCQFAGIKYLLTFGCYFFGAKK